MIKNKIVSLAICFVFFSLSLSAQRDTTVVTNDIPVSYNVFEVIQQDDSLQTTIKIYQDKRIENLFLDRQQASKSAVVSGYRVQVFSSNIHQTAKSAAFRVERMVMEKFPHQGIYVTYTSPFWKVRVGDFRTLEEAQAFRDELMGAFPELKREMYVVRDQISLVGSK